MQIENKDVHIRMSDVLYAELKSYVRDLYGDGSRGISLTIQRAIKEFLERQKPF